MSNTTDAPQMSEWSAQNKAEQLLDEAWIFLKDRDDSLLTFEFIQNLAESFDLHVFGGPDSPEQRWDWHSGMALLALHQIGENKSKRRAAFRMAVQHLREFVDTIEVWGGLDDQVDELDDRWTFMPQSLQDLRDHPSA